MGVYVLQVESRLQVLRKRAGPKNLESGITLDYENTDGLQDVCWEAGLWRTC